MANALRSVDLRNRAAPILVLAGVAVVIAAQFTKAVPITGAIALIAWGTCLAVRRRCSLLLLAASLYAPLSIIAVMAQVDLALRSAPPWRVVVALDAGLAVMLLYKLAHETGERLAARLCGK